MTDRMKGITMPNTTTRRVRAGTEPPPDMLWVCNPPVSIGWDMEELKAFARQIAEVCSK